MQQRPQMQMRPTMQQQQFNPMQNRMRQNYGF